MRIEEDLKLDFKDVLIRPKRSTLRSRSDVDLPVTTLPAIMVLSAKAFMV